MAESVTGSAELSTDHYNSLMVDSSETSRCDHDDEWFSLDSLTADAETFAGMVVQSALIRKLVSTIIRLAPHKNTVLIQGESGTGKELVAHALHRLGPMPRGPLVIFNCSNLVGSLAEAQLFGHVRGAFTDARENSLGYFRSADGGTLFLDEVGELPLGLQAKLLRAVETYEIQPVGSTKSYTVNVRLVAATNRELRAMVKVGQFRDDLYYRLNVANIRIPPLREWRDGIGALTAHFIECSNRLFEKQVRRISRRALDLLKFSDWPGNVREFANAIQGAVMLSAGDRLCVADFPHLSRGETQTSDLGSGIESGNVLSAGSASQSFSLREATHQATKNALIRALRETGGNGPRTAQLLGVSRYTVYRLIARYGLARRSPSYDDSHYE